MANIVDINVENTTNVNHCTSFKEELNSKSCELIEEQKDSRVTDPEGAQSPASSTYADCEDQNENSLSENSLEVQNKEIPDEKSSSKLDNYKQSNNKESEVPCSKPPESINIDDSSSVSQKYVKLDNNENVDTSKNEYPIDQEENKCINEDKYVEISDNYDEYLEDDNCDERSDQDECSEGESDQQEDDRENGDGEEGNEDENAATQKELDDDEDRRNPQYIPKKGFFYEHDDRTVMISSEEEPAEEVKKEAEPKEPESAKVKGRRPIPDGKWQHDLYREEDQQPKSAQELIDLYGYDIRNEESAPKARRRRKYGRGPNKYTRKWNDEGAYSKQPPLKPFKNRKVSFKKEDYEEQFPALDKKSYVEMKNSERPLPRKSYPVETRNEEKSKGEYRGSSKSNVGYQERPRNFVKRIPGTFKESRSSYNDDNEVFEVRHQSTTYNTQYASNERKYRGRGTQAKSFRNVGYEPTNLQFTAGSRGRAKRLIKPNQNYYPSKLVSEEEMQELNEQMSAADLGLKKRIPVDRQQYGDSKHINDNSDTTGSNAISNVRSKRYSHQRQRLLPEVNKVNSANLSHQNVQPNLQSITHTVQNVAASALCQPMTSPHTSMPLMTQNQCTPPPQTASAPLSVPPTSIPSSSLAVSASLIPLSAPPLTASGPGLSAGAPPLPIMGFFQHPQGFTNQPAATQLYTREQTVMAGPSNQSVQLVAFLPASPMLSNTNPSQSAPPPPPPPPPAGFPTTVMSYQQTAQTPQSAPTFNSESYPMPPVTLAPIHQPPEVYQSRGGVTYYNTRSQVKPRSPPPPRIKTAIPIVPPPSSESLK